jgi:ribonuclease Z
MPDLVVEKSFLSQRFAKLKFGHISVVGYSVAGEETVVQVPELGVCFDTGRAPQFSLSTDILCLSHAHMDHVGGLAYFISQRFFQGMKPPVILCPDEVVDPLERMLAAFRDVERQHSPYVMIGLRDREEYEVRKDFKIRAHAVHHAGPCLGYSLISVREKLKAQYMGKPSPELAQMKKDGVEIQYILEVPLVTYLGDTGAGPVFDEPDIINSEVLITECTFFEPDHRQRAKSGKHLHVADFARILARLNNKLVVLTHVSRRTGLRKAKKLLKAAVHEELLKNVHFLMDFDGAQDAGDLDDIVPVPKD